MSNPTLATGTPLKNTRYRITRHLKSGGFGAVYTAEDTLFGKHQCVIKESFGTTPADAEQFEREAAILSTLKHPHLVQVTGTFTEPNQAQYMVMEYIEGEDLEEMLARSPAGLPESQVLVWADQVLDALAYCHGFTPPVIHRDIKPSNIRIRRSDGKAVLVDFGIAKIGDVTQQTQPGAWGFSPLYSPIEQRSRAGIGTGPYSDIYALGATLYHLLTGVEPPEASHVSTGTATLHPPRSLRPAITPQTERVILTAMQTKVQDRYQSADEMRRDLKGLLPTALCPHCGAAVRKAARFCQNCSLAQTVQPLAFAKTATQVSTVAELVQACDQHWQIACDLLRTGEIESWLGGFGALPQQQTARTARTRHAKEMDIALEEFLETVTPTRSKPILSVQPAPLDFGKIRAGDAKVLNLVIANSGRGYLHGQVAADPPAWLSVQPPSFGCIAGGQQSIQVEVKATALAGDAAGVVHNGRVIVQSNRGQQTVDVRVAVVENAELRVSIATVDFGVLSHGSQAHRSFEVSNPGGGVLQASVRSLVDWIVLVDAAGNPQQQPQIALPGLTRKQAATVHVALDSRPLNRRGPYSGSIRIESPNTPMPVVTVPVSVRIDPPYRLDANDPASAITTPEQLWHWCDAHWPVALAHLAAGRLEACLAFLGEPTRAQDAAQARRAADPNLGLERLLRACGAPPATRLAHNADELKAKLGFGLIPKFTNAASAVTLRIENKNKRGYLCGQVTALQPWLSIPQPGFGCLPGQAADVEVQVDQRARRRSYRFNEPLFEIATE